jgi:hypothetical protein
MEKAQEYPLMTIRHYNNQKKEAGIATVSSENLQAVMKMPL